MATLFDQIATPTRLTIFHSVADTTMQENELIRIGDSISLECNIMECEELVSSPFDLCLIFHPWQWLGGCMDDHNCYSLSMTALRSGRFKRVVRFNARGVGRSLGWKSLGYLSDGQDAYNLILKLLGDSAESADPTHQKTCSLIAYSYGSLVASEALRLLIANQEITNIQARGFISVGFPLGVLSRFFLCSHNSWDSLITSLKQANPTFPFMLVMGDTDQFSSLESTEILVKKAAGSSATIPFKIVEQCDHFFITSAAQKVLREICLEYIQSL